MSSSSKEIGTVAIVPVAICLWMDFLIPSAFFGISMAFSASSNTDAALIFCSAEEEEEEEDEASSSSVVSKEEEERRKKRLVFCVCLLKIFWASFFQSPGVVVAAIGLFPFLLLMIYNGRKGFRSIDRSIGRLKRIDRHPSMDLATRVRSMQRSIETRRTRDDVIDRKTHNINSHEWERLPLL